LHDACRTGGPCRKPSFFVNESSRRSPGEPFKTAAVRLRGYKRSRSPMSLYRFKVRALFGGCRGRRQPSLPRSSMNELTRQRKRAILTHMTPQPPLETATLDAVLDSLLGHDPPPLVVALNEAGIFVPMPPSVPASLGPLFDGCASVLQLVVDDDLPVVIETWERARQAGVARGDVRLLGDPSHTVNVHYVDARHRYGVLLCFIIGHSGPTDFAHRGETAIRPRVWTARKGSSGSC
jgi:hypothetical protein